MDSFLIKILMVDDDSMFSLLVSESLKREGNIDFKNVNNATDFFNALDFNPDIVIVDYNLPDKNGLEILTELKQRCNAIIPIVISGQEEIDVVVEAYKKGAHRYIIKNENATVELIQNIKAIRKNLAIKKELETLKDSVIIQHDRYQNIIGNSAAMNKVFKLMQKVENIDMPVLITGNNGTGKEMVAQALHYNSNRKRKRFVAVNVAAIPEDLIESELFGHEKGAFTGANGKRIGKFEEANKGTLFLDEIGEMDLSLQTKLLRVLQERKLSRLGGNKTIDLSCRVITATNKDFWEEVQAGRFREDLYFRLQGFIIDLPALKDRENDIIVLAKHFVQEFCKQQKAPIKDFSSEAIKQMMTYAWPGNVRELKSMMERAILISENQTIEVDDLVFLENNLQRV